MNRHRHLNSIGWIPGLTWAMKYAAEWDVRPLKNFAPGKWIFGKDRWEHWAGHKFAHLPHSIAEAISYSVRYTGSHANAWDEMKIEELIASAQDMGLFINHPEYANDLRREFKTFLGDRWFAMIRKYWWVPFIATIAIAIERGTKETEGGGHGGH